MIKFFSKIRRKSRSENKLSKYLIFAIGEVFLGLIGIVIQLNTWNNIILHKLEVNVTKRNINKFSHLNEIAFTGCLSLFDLIGTKKKKIQIQLVV